MKVYLINLDKDVARLASADAQLKKLGVEYARVPAVMGRDLSASEKKRSVNGLRFWCAIGKKVLDGEIGCALSHFSIYRRMKDREVACILEDDVLLDSRFREVLDRVEKSIDVDKPQVVLLSNHSENTGIGDSHIGYESESNMGFELRQTKGDCFTEGYVLTARAAQAILVQNYPIIIPCDSWARWVRHGAIELYHAFPTVCRQAKNEFRSSIVTSKTELVKDMSAHRFVIHKMKRLLGKMIDVICYKATGR